MVRRVTPAVSSEAAAFEELDLMKDTVMVLDIVYPQIGDACKLFLDAFGRRLRRVGFLDKDGVLTLAIVVTGPEVKLVLRPVRRTKINQWILRHACSGFRQIKSDQARDAIMIPDDEDRFALREQFRARLANHAGHFLVSSDTRQWIVLRRQRPAGDFSGQV